jgi:hypothetical protein
VSYAGGGFTDLTSQIKDTQDNKLSGTIDAIEFAGDKLYALDRTTTGDKLYTIDTTNRVATLVGDLPTGFVTNGDDFVYDAANSRFLATATGTPISVCGKFRLLIRLEPQRSVRLESKLAKISQYYRYHIGQPIAYPLT